MSVNRHSLNIKNLRAVSGATVDNSAGYSQISYDTETGDLLEAWHVGNHMTNWTVYHNPDVIHVCNTSKHMTMQQLADAVRDAVTDYRRMREYIKQMNSAL